MEYSRQHGKERQEKRDRAARFLNRLEQSRQRWLALKQQSASTDHKEPTKRNTSSESSATFTCPTFQPNELTNDPD